LSASAIALVLRQLLDEDTDGFFSASITSPASIRRLSRFRRPSARRPAIEIGTAVIDMRHENLLYMCSC
jgi:hypothetical protein